MSTEEQTAINDTIVFSYRRMHCQLKHSSLSISTLSIVVLVVLFEKAPLEIVIYTILSTLLLEDLISETNGFMTAPRALKWCPIQALSWSSVA